MDILKPHVSLNVSNIDASTAFYEKLFGVAPVKRRSGYAKFDLKEPALNLTMQEGRPTGVNVSHFGIQVRTSADVAAAKSRLESVGLTTRVEENVDCCYAIQDKVWVTDPDNNAWEVFLVKEDSPAKTALPQADRTCCAPTCCTPAENAST